LGESEVGYGTEASHALWHNTVVSLESIDEIKNQVAFKGVSVDKDPEGLWQPIVAMHRINCISHIVVVIKQAAWDRYMKCRQGAFESVITYRKNFDAALKAYIDQGNVVLEIEDTAMHFFMGLDTARYVHMKTTVHNYMTIGAQQPPQTVNEVYTIAANWIRTHAVHRHGQATTFVMTRLDNKPSGKKHGKAKSGKEQGNQHSTYVERLANTRCHKCKVLGYYANKCPLLTTK
jgi:hypothetical protein